MFAVSTPSGLPPNVQHRLAMKNPSSILPNTPTLQIEVPPIIPPPPSMLPIPMVPAPYPMYPDTTNIQEPPAKKHKTEPKLNLIPEDEFNSSYEKRHQTLQVAISIQVPERIEKKEEWDKNLQGQLLSIKTSITDTVGTVKEMISQKLEVPVNKQKLKTDSVPVMKDQFTLAYYNLEGKEVMYLTIKERGGRKK